MARGCELSLLSYDRFEPGWHVTRLEPDVSVVVSAAPDAIPGGDVADAIWEAALRERPALFDGRVFVAADVSPCCIEGYWTNYRFLFAQLKQPDLFPRPYLRALAVNGLLRCADGFVLGRRQTGAVYRPGCWQTVPAGSVEAHDGTNSVDIEAQIRAELREEIGFGPDLAETIRPVVAMEHPGGRVLDIGCLVETALTFEAVERLWSAQGNGEYDALRLVALDAVPAFLKQAGPDLLVSARILLDRRSGVGE